MTPVGYYKKKLFVVELTINGVVKDPLASFIINKNGFDSRCFLLPLS